MFIDKSQALDIARFNQRVNEIAYGLANVNDKHDDVNRSVVWEFTDNFDPQLITIKISNYSYHNTSCSCHPEYEFDVFETHHTITLNDVTNDDYFHIDPYGYDTVKNHPVINALNDEIRAKREEEEMAERRYIEEEEMKEREKQKRYELGELERLKRKYGV